jgi:hypothetical protein
MRVLFDSSALLKRYLPEAGREALLGWVAQASPAVAAAHCKIQLYAAIDRVRRDTGVGMEAYRITCDEIERNFSDFEVVPMSTLVERAAIRALEASPMPALDALHVGAAVAAAVDLFVTADPRQYQGARAVGLKAALLEN